jgi:hypothetical protein
MMNSRMTVVVFMLFATTCLGENRPPHKKLPKEPDVPLPVSKTSPDKAKEAAENFEIVADKNTAINFKKEYTRKELEDAKIHSQGYVPSAGSVQEIWGAGFPQGTPDHRPPGAIDKFMFVGPHLVYIRIHYSLDIAEGLLERFGNPTSTNRGEKYGQITKQDEILTWKFPTITRSRTITFLRSSSGYQLTVEANPTPADIDAAKARIKEIHDKSQKNLGF